MKKLPLFVVLLLFILPISAVAIFIITEEFKSRTEIVVSNQKILVNVATGLIKEKLDRVVDVGVSIAGKTLFRQSIEKGQWDDALKQVETVSKKFTYIDDIALYNPDGILKAIASGDPSVIGSDFSLRDYYQGISNKWEPYISEVFKRAAEPKYNVVAVAIPIKSDDQRILGGFGMAIKLDTIQEWIKDLDIGPLGSAYVVDQRGHIIAHRESDIEWNVIDYSLAPAVQKILKGESGVEVLSDPMESGKQLVAYAPVPIYGWGVVILYPENVAFKSRNEGALLFSIILALGIFTIGFSLYHILRDRKLMKAQRDRETVLLESIDDGVVAIDRNWNITLWNKSAVVLTGWSKDEALGKPLGTVLKVLREHDRKEDTSFIEEAMAQRKATLISNNVILLKKDGSEIAVGDSAAPIIGTEGVEGVIIVFRDVSLEIEKRHLRSDFMYASHQLRTPVTEALWNLEIAIDEQDPDKMKEDLRIVHQSLHSIKKLSEHLVSVSEIDQGNVAVKLSEVKLIDVLTEVQGKLEKKANTRGVTMSIATVSSLIAISTDKKLLTKTLFEVIENAVNYSHKESDVQIAVTQQEKNILIEITDTGVGIPEEDQAIIFTKFFRGSNRGSENPGDGLGLYLAKAYTNLLGGKIWFESVEGEGTTFFVSLPIE